MITLVPSWRTFLRVAFLLLLVLLCLPRVTFASNCPNEAVRSQLHSAELPDCRAYELVSPVSKFGWPMAATRVAEDGNRVIAQSLGSFIGSEQEVLVNFYEFVRNEYHGWEAFPLNPPASFAGSLGGGTEPLAANPDLTEGLFNYRTKQVADPRNDGFYTHVIPGGQLTEVGPRVPKYALEATLATERLGTSTPSASSDLSRMFYSLHGSWFAAHGQLEYTWPGDETAPVDVETHGHILGWASLYEYDGTGNERPKLVGVSENGHLIGQCGTVLGYPEGGEFNALQGDALFNAIASPSGSRAFFTVGAGPCTENGHVVGVGPVTNELFASEAAPEGKLRSIPISEPTTGLGGDCSACNTSSPQAAVFQGASEDGSKVFFLSSQQLLAGAEATNLYEYDFNASKGSRVTLIAPDVSGVSRISENGTYVYFVAKAILTNSPNSYGDSASLEGDNLYSYDTENRAVSFIGDLSSADVADWQPRDERPVDDSYDGRWLVFASSANLTHSVTNGESQVFEYDSMTKTLIWVSRAQDGALGGAFPASIVFPRYTNAFDPSPQHSSVSDDGSVAFQSEAALTPHALMGYNNVYEYRDGISNLISDGQDRTHELGDFSSVSLIGIDRSGQDIFFTTADPLIPQDGDTQEDIYDARVDGGFLPAPSATCSDEGCRGPLAPTLSTNSPGTLDQSIGDQVVEPPVVPPSVKPLAKKKVKSKTKKRSKHRARKRSVPRKGRRLGGTGSKR